MTRLVAALLAAAAFVPQQPAPHDVAPTKSLEAACVTEPVPAEQQPQFVVDNFSFGNPVYGNDALWAVAWQRSWWDDVEPEPGRGMKLGWFRTQPGHLAIAVDQVWTDDRQTWRLDEHGLAHVPEGYGTLHFQVSGVNFSAPGCWAITGYLIADDSAAVISVTQFVIWVPPLGAV